MQSGNAWLNRRVSPLESVIEKLELDRVEMKLLILLLDPCRKRSKKTERINV